MLDFGIEYVGIKYVGKEEEEEEEEVKSGVFTYHI